MNTCMRMILRVQYAIALTICATGAAAQNDMPITITDADKIFLEQNLYLIAGSLNIDIQRAREIQSKAYPNPEVSAELNAYDPQNNKAFHVGNTGQKAFAIEQVILLGGKRKHEIELARKNTRYAELQLEDLLRNLKLQLHSSLLSIYFDYLAIKKYDNQLAILDTIISNYETQAQKGNVSLKEVVRLKSTYLQVNNDKTELLQSIQNEQKNLQLLLHTESTIVPVIPDVEWSRLQHLPNIDSLSMLALENRPDLRLASLDVDISRLNLAYQKSLAVPDIAVGGSYDQRGGAFNNQVNMTLGIPIPIWNRNKGNIRAAAAGIKASTLNSEIIENKVNAEVRQAWYNMQLSIREYQKLNQLYNEDFKTVLDGITDNFRKRNISILEFIDFFESYNQSISEINRIRKNLTQKAEEINYTVATPIYKLQ